ncbi:MAG: hypothetical protein AVDCRST_MAG77-3348 [uncultured Chloroflexi bacterium]|uniref:Uncharacterized protein n=1 Tax=uncultured Chloroflexota bacterium TaxID=166587 RepID=A0A6J4JBR4_9CHLR|nr:MAG: hypothetical protein AVDCRST_MAG77-3348 [uncultured Chloroflexota bacterium]
MTLADLDATSAAHLRACLWCYRFYTQGVGTEGWKIADATLVGTSTGPSTAAVSAAPDCAACEHAAQYLWLFLTRRVDGQNEELGLAVCRACGHVEPLAVGAPRAAWRPHRQSLAHQQRVGDAGGRHGKDEIHSSDSTPTGHAQQAHASRQTAARPAARRGVLRSDEGVRVP